MSDTNDFAEIINRIARVPTSSIPPRKPQQSPSSGNDNPAAPEKNNEDN